MMNAMPDANKFRGCIKPTHEAKLYRGTQQTCKISQLHIRVCINCAYGEIAWNELPTVYV